MDSLLFDKAGKFDCLGLQGGTMITACGMAEKLRLKGCGLRPYCIQISAPVFFEMTACYVSHSRR